MEALKQRRGPLRRASTRAAHLLEEMLSAPQTPIADELAAIIAQSEEKDQKLEELDELILSGIQNAGATVEEYEQEFDAVETYRERGARLSVMGNRLLARLDQAAQAAVIQGNPRTDEVAPSKRRFRLPEIELKKFSGDPKEWLGFWAQFRKIHEDEAMEPEDKYQYLIQATVSQSKARELVDSFPPTAGNYGKAIDHLKSRFGRDEVLVEVYVRELLRLVLNNELGPKVKEALATRYDKLETQLRALETLGVTSDKYASMLYPLVESCLPEDSLRAWERSRTFQINDISQARSGETPTQQRLTALMTFLRGEVDGEERVRMALNGFGVNKETARRAKVSTIEDSSSPTAAGLFNKQVPGKKDKEGLSCIFLRE